MEKPLVWFCALLVAGSCRPLAPAVPAPQPASPTQTSPTRTSPPARDTAIHTVPTPLPQKDSAKVVVPLALVPPPVSREFRGVWVASVSNIDWPSRRGMSTQQAQAELLQLLDRAVQLKLNAIIFQVRPAADALYASKIEPWSEYLTGEQGKAPDPYWDPLAFAVKEAHARGLELHAWFNPYRARHDDARSKLAPSHIARTSPSLVKSYGPYLWMDPGEPAVRARTLKVVLDVVQRYDIDGVHIDDYFYPYQERNRAGRAIDFPDAVSWKRYVRGGGTLARDDWRRRNVDLLVQSLYEGIHRTKPWVRFGISPFGIWRPGFPAQVRGLDAYTELFADSRKWLREGWADYFTPQLYWPTTQTAQSYPALLEWWAGENLHQRHLWPGNFTSRAGGTGSSSWPVNQLVEQIRVTRLQPGATGNVHFSMKSFLVNQAGMNDALMAGPYSNFALVPASPWLQQAAPPRPVVQILDSAQVRQLRLSFRGNEAPWQWLVRARVDTGWVTQLLVGSTRRWTIPRGASAAFITVSTVNRTGETSEPVSLASAPGSSETQTQATEKKQQ